MKRFAVLLAALPLAGCLTDQSPPPPVAVMVSGPKFAASRFNCGHKPVPPDPQAVGLKAGSAAARYEDDVATWGQHCSNRLQSVGGELKAAGQVVKAR